MTEPHSSRQSLSRNRIRGWYCTFFALVTSAFAESFLWPFAPPASAVASAGRIAFVFLAVFSIYYCASLGFHGFRENLRNLLSLTFVTCGSICIVSLGRFLAQSVVMYQGDIPSLGPVQPESLYFAIPFAAGGMILQAILGLEYALVPAFVLLALMGVFMPAGVPLGIYAFITTTVGSISLHRFRSRSAYIKAAIHVTLASIACALVSLLMAHSPTLADFVLRIGGAFFGAAFCVVLAAGITPLFEYLGGYVTDIRLIEMATLDHPLLKELSVQAPGTWNHSMVMGMMAESAADAVGADPVVARVGAYFHDIGKIKKPLYFVENQSSGENRHDRLSPSMSALIIRSHVKDGVELGLQHKLPQVILDMIPQHHGTSLIEYFYDKAVKEEAEGDGPDENLYSYPGPRPQTKEAGILMLADGIEAAARTIEEHTPDRIRGLVQKMINKVFRSGELDECELTLKELHLIARCFTRVLTGIYHQRIAYGEPAEKVNRDDEDERLPRDMAADDDDEEEGLKRLGQD